MIHDPELLEYLEQLERVRFDGEVFRTTGQNADPTAFSSNGGRWAPPNGEEGGCSTLYTSTTREGSISEVASYLKLQTPVPNRPLNVHTLEVAPEKTLRLRVADFEKLGINPNRYSERNYSMTQLIGSAANFLEFDGLIAPSARYDCDNLMLYESNYSLDSKLKVVATEVVQPNDWQQFG